MLPRRFRLVRERDFRDLYRRSERLAGTYVLIRVAANRVRITRIGTVMSTKVGKLSVVRNRHKRQAREVIKELWPRLPMGWDILVTVTRAVPSRDKWPTFREDIRKLLERRFLL